MRFLKEPFGQAVAIMIAAWILVEFGIPYIPPLFGVASAPAPGSVVFQYMLTVMVGVLLWVSDNEERWRAFKRPIHRTVVDPDRRILRGLALVAFPVIVGFLTYDQVRPALAAPPSFRAIHPAPPGTITFQGESMTLSGLENPLRDEGDLAALYEEGKRVYYENCLACHGDGLSGDGHFAHGFNPAPLSFQDGGTISQLTESFVFWRIAKGGPGLPNEGTPWNSAMPIWEDYLTADEIWAVTAFLYEQTGYTPRTWGEEGEDPEASSEGQP